MKVVLDSNIFILSFYWAGNPRKVFERITNGLDELYITDEILKEIVLVMSEKKFATNTDKLVLQEYRKIKIVKPKDYLEIVQTRQSLI